MAEMTKGSSAIKMKAQEIIAIKTGICLRFHPFFRNFVAL